MVDDVVDPILERSKRGIGDRLGSEVGAPLTGHQPDHPGRILGQQSANRLPAKRRHQSPANRKKQVGQLPKRLEAGRLFKCQGGRLELGGPGLEDDGRRRRLFLADGKRQAMDEPVVGFAHQGIELVDRILGDHPHIRRVGRVAGGQSQRHLQFTLERRLVPLDRSLRQHHIKGFVNVGKRFVVGQQPVPAGTDQDDLPRRCFQSRLQRMRVTMLHPHPRGGFLVGDHRRRGNPIDRPQQGVVRRPEDPQQHPGDVAGQHAVTLAIVAQAKHLVDQLREFFRREFKQHRLIGGGFGRAGGFDRWE